MEIKSQLRNYRHGILETMSSMNRDRFVLGISKKSDVKKLAELCEAYCTMARISGDKGVISDARALISVSEKMSKEYDYMMNTLNEGFENPFDDIYSDEESIDTRYEEKVDLTPLKDGIKIGRISLWNTDTNNKVMYKNGKMIAGQFFGEGDVIERCPVRFIRESDLYSENIRDFAFDIDRSKGIYAIPFGYASFYRDSASCNHDGNADYKYVDDKNGQYIMIYATKNIKKNQEIVLTSDEDDFANTVMPGQFEYGDEPFYSIKRAIIA